jgi:hypothetical protein
MDSRDGSRYCWCIQYKPNSLANPLDNRIVQLLLGHIGSRSLSDAHCAAGNASEGPEKRGVAHGPWASFHQSPLLHKRWCWTSIWWLHSGSTHVPCHFVVNNIQENNKISRSNMTKAFWMYIVSSPDPAHLGIPCFFLHMYVGMNTYVGLHSADQWSQW